jgi:uncharacterized membrane protein
MEVVIILFVSFLALRGIGWLGVTPLASWNAAGRGALAIMFLFTGGAHFSSMKYDMAAMIPPPLPDGLWVIYLSGVLEIIGARGLLHPRTRRLAGIGLALLLVALFPAIVYATLNALPLRGEPPTSLWLRTPEQVLFIGLLWWAAIRETRALARTPEPKTPA